MTTIENRKDVEKQLADGIYLLEMTTTENSFEKVLELI